MSQKALLKILGDRPIAYHPILAKIAGSVKAGILLSQLCYWQDRTGDPDGWVYKSRGELLEETGLSRKEQDSARKSLRDLDLVSEELRRVPPRVHFRVDVDRLVELLEASSDGSERGQSTGPKGANQLVRKGPIDLPPTDPTSGPEGADRLVRNGQVLEGTESTSETTPETTATRSIDHFPSFWEIYPRRVGKRAARAAFRRALGRASAEDIIAGAERYRDDPNRDPTFTAHPTTWLNRDGWEDEPLPARSNGQQTRLADRLALSALQGGDDDAEQGSQGTGRPAARGLPGA